MFLLNNLALGFAVALTLDNSLLLPASSLSDFPAARSIYDKIIPVRTLESSHAKLYRR